MKRLRIKVMPSDYDRAAQGIDDSLSDLNLSYVDLMLIHQPGSNDEEVYKVMEQAVRDGKVRSIGISNYYTKAQAGYIAIPGSSNPDHIAENYDIFNFELTEDEMQQIYNLDRQKRYENW